MAKIKHCMCGCMYEQADCPNCNKVSDKARIAELEAALREGIVCTSEHYGATRFLKIARAALGEKKG